MVAKSGFRDKCSVKGCKELEYACKLCSKHYNQEFDENKSSEFVRSSLSWG